MATQLDLIKIVWCGIRAKIMRVKFSMTHLVNRAKITHDVPRGAHEGEIFEGEIIPDGIYMYLFQ